MSSTPPPPQVIVRVSILVFVQFQDNLFRRGYISVICFQTCDASSVCEFMSSELVAVSHGRPSVPAAGGGALASDGGLDWALPASTSQSSPEL